MVSSAAPRRTRRKWQVVALPRVLLMVASLLSALLVSVHFAAPAAALPLAQTSVITNNIQGASATSQDDANTDSKWTTMVTGFFRDAPVVLIQEAGPSGPPGATEQTPIVTDGNTVRHFLWRPRLEWLAQVYFLQTNDPTNPRAVGGRVNIAIVTRSVPDEVRVVANPVTAGRTALGVRFGNNWYFSIHGLSGGGNDSAALLDAIDTAVDSWNPAYTYTVGGDFNRDPAALAAQNNNTGIPPGAHRLTTGRATHQAGGELDYFVTNDPSTPTSPAHLINGAQSDHYPVMVGALQAMAEPPDLSMMISGDGINGSIPNETLLESKMWWSIAELVSTYKRSVTFVGDDTSSDGTPDEGTPGEQISAIAAQDATAVAKYKPNVVLLQAGTWDIQDGDASGAAGRLSAPIDQIQAADPSTVVMVATLGPTTNAADEALVTAFNTSVQQMVATRVADGQRVVLADMSNLTTADLNADGVTPNASGQQKMADSFTGALIWASVMGWISEPNGPAPGGSVCDLYAFYGTPCVGAYSMTRAMYAGYDGPLYQVTRASDNTTADIGLLSAGGDVDASGQNSFCAGTPCTVTRLYDQSPQDNDLTIAPAGGGAAPGADNGAGAAALPVTIGGTNKAYGLDIEPGMGYRDNNTRGIATVGQPEGMYMVASGTHVNNQCCFDFGNAEINSQDNGNGHMDAVNFGTNCYYSPCTGGGPWVAADMENGLFQGGNGSNTANAGNSSDFVTAMLKNDGQTTYALKGGNAQSGGLSTWWNGSLPTNVSGYKPMNQEGAIILGTGGDNSNWDTGSFFEGVMTAGYPSDAADAAVQANIAAAGYGGNSGGVAVPSSAAGQAVVHDGYSSVYTVDSANGHLQESYLPAMGDPWSTQDLSAKYHTPAVLPGTKPVTLVHDGYASVYTVDAGDSTHAAGDLQETYLPAMGDPWSTQDLSAKYHTPQVQAGTSPVSIVHDGYTSVYTVDGNHDLQETYLPAMGDPWSTQDLSANYHTPPTTVTPTAVVHSGYASVYTADAGSQHLQETYLPAMGDPWSTQDLSANYHTPPVAPGTAPVALTHAGYASVYTVDQASLHVQETYLPAMGDPWSTQDLSAKYLTPVTAETPIVLLHPDTTGALTYSSVYTADQFNDHLQETYLPAMGDPWSTQDLSAKYLTPPVAVAGSSPASSSVVHDGYTSVYVPYTSSRHLQETYLPAMGQQWAAQDLTAKYQTPAIMAGTAAIAVTHDGYTSVYTVDAGDSAHAKGDLQETYLPAMGDPWSTQDLSAKYHTPTVLAGTAPVALYHTGYTSVYTDDAGGNSIPDTKGDVQETYLPAMSDAWSTQDLTARYSIPTAQPGDLDAVLHYDTGGGLTWTSVFTLNVSNSDLQETYLPAIGGSWATQDLTTQYGTPAG